MKKKTHRFMSSCFCGILLFSCIQSIYALDVSRLRVEALANPVGIDVDKPNFSWILQAEGRGIKQTAYEIKVFSNQEKEQEIWNSGKTAVFDMGQNMVGCVKIAVKGEPGTKLRFCFGEMLNDTGSKSGADDGPGGSVYTYNGPGATFGDWLAFEETNSRYVSICYYAYVTQLMEKICHTLSASSNDTYDTAVISYSTLYQNIKAEFQTRYVKSNGQLTEQSQTAYLLALKMDLFPDETAKANAITFLRNKIITNGNKLSTRFVGTGIINQMLSELKPDGRINYKATVPANTTATLYLPIINENDLIYESGILAEESEGVEFIGLEDGKAIFQLQSGSYHFYITEITTVNYL